MVLLALAVGVNTAIFSVVSPILVRPLPFKGPDRLVAIKQTHPQWGDDLTVSVPTFLDWRRMNDVFEGLGAYTERPALVEGKSASERLWTAAVSWDLFRTLGVAPQLGRLFEPADDKPGAAPAVLLSAGLWKRAFGGDPSALGQSLRLDGRSVLVVGVMPEGFRFPLRPSVETVELWTSLPEDPAIMGRESIFLRVAARLKEGVALSQAQSGMSLLMESINRSAAPEERFGVRVVPLGQAETGDIRAPLAVFAASVGLVLLTACINLGGLILTRATGRQSELAIRNVMGATRWRLARQMVTEMLTLSVLGGGLGVLLAYWILEVTAHAVPQRYLISDAISLNVDSLIFALAVSTASGLLTGAIPAWPASKPELVETLARHGRGAQASGGRGLGRWLVAAEVALAVVLATGAGLLIKSFWQLVSVERGFDSRNAVMAPIWLPEDRYPDRQAQLGFYRRLGERFESFPGVEKLGAVQSLPLGTDLWQTFLSVEGRTFPEEAPPVSDFRVVWGDYFEALGIRILRGRGFERRDDASSPPVAIVNRALASRLWPDEEALGRRLRAVGSEGPGEWATVVGVVEDVAGSFRKRPRPAIYRPLRQFTTPHMVVVARLSGPPETAAALRAVVAELDRWIPAPRVRRMDDLVSDSLAEDRYGMLLLGGFAATALLLGLIGCYAVTAFAVTQSRQEIGVRMALGARPAQIVGLFLNRGAVTAAIGLTIGIGLAVLLADAMRSLLYGVSPRDPAIFALVALSTAGAVAAACYLPSRRAARVDPVRALRSL